MSSLLRQSANGLSALETRLGEPLADHMVHQTGQRFVGRDSARHRRDQVLAMSLSVVAVDRVRDDRGVERLIEFPLDLTSAAPGSGWPRIEDRAALI